MLVAIPNAIRTRRDFEQFDACLRVEHAAQVTQWEEELEAWMEDKSLPDPFAVPVISKLWPLRVCCTF